MIEKITTPYDYVNSTVKKILRKSTPFYNENTQQATNRREIPQADKRHIFEKPTANLKLKGKRRKISS